MIQIRFTGWKPGLRKVTLDKLLREKVPMPLADAKRVVDRMLEGEEVVVEVDSSTNASDLVVQARDAGAICEQVDAISATTSRP